MQNQLDTTSSQSKPPTSWTTSEKEKLSAVLAIVCANQAAYGTAPNMQSIYSFYKMKLEGRFPMASILQALDTYTDTNRDIPQPADIINIIIPPKKRVTEAQLVTSTKAQERNGWDPFSDDQDVINAYRVQEKQDLANNKKHDELVLPVGHLVKRIGGSYAQK